jgi:non-heme chloroperoxidase
MLTTFSDEPVDRFRRQLIMRTAGVAATAGIALTGSVVAGESHGAGPRDTALITRTASTFTARDGTQLYYKDWGSDPSVVFSHGWPLSADAFEGHGGIGAWPTIDVDTVGLVSPGTVMIWIPMRTTSRRW